ncbi:hydantoinase/oxoprolinase family protein [Nonomuraea recticatena]|uniref:hydantoinase/oxoprolinase family protein n=1 Tax=Nonomuraea recticatena TaxID=46178 RepID=UPI003622D6D0
MNAALRPLAERAVAAFSQALKVAGIDAPLFLSQNDGTLMDLSRATRYPVATFASGPTNSMRGAAYLSGLTDCAVVDIGGTTSDVGILVGGFPARPRARRWSPRSAPTSASPTCCRSASAAARWSPRTARWGRAAWATGCPRRRWCSAAAR